MLGITSGPMAHSMRGGGSASPLLSLLLSQRGSRRSRRARRNSVGKLLEAVGKVDSLAAAGLGLGRTTSLTTMLLGSGSGSAAMSLSMSETSSRHDTRPGMLGAPSAALHCAACLDRG